MDHISSFDIGRHQVDLRYEGFTILKEFASLAEIERLNKLVVEVEKFVAEGSPIDNLEIASASNRKSYQTLAGSSKSLVDVRGKDAPWDSGMIDVFNPHYFM